MPYQYLDDIATADIAFRATAESLEKLFIAAANAAVNVMVEDLNVIDPKETRTFSLENASLEMLLFNYLQEFIYYKDAESLILRAAEISVKKENDQQYTMIEVGPFRLSVIGNIDSTTHYHRDDR